MQHLGGRGCAASLAALRAGMGDIMHDPGNAPEGLVILCRIRGSGPDEGRPETSARGGTAGAAWPDL